MGIRRTFRGSLQRGGSPSLGITALDFPGNLTAGSDIRLLWDGASLLPRIAHTAIWRARYKPQVGFYALSWHSTNTGTFDSAYAYGAHPYPTDGTYDGSGYTTGGTGGAGTEQYMELAAAGAGLDKIAIPMEPPFLVNDPDVPSSPAQAATWLVQARTSELINAGANIRHRVWPDLESAPNDYIERVIATGDLGGAGSTPAFYFGASDWRSGQGGGGAGTNDETPCCLLRGMRLFNAALALADMQAEMAAIGTNTPGSAAGGAALWYINDNPAPSDVTDKSGAGHHPRWPDGNSNRPALWTG